MIQGSTEVGRIHFTTFQWYCWG